MFHLSQSGHHFWLSRRQLRNRWALVHIEIPFAALVRGVGRDALAGERHQIVDVHSVDLNDQIVIGCRQSLPVRAPGHTSNSYGLSAKVPQCLACLGSASHTFTVLSQPPVASCFPSGLQATLYTESLWPRRVSNSLPVSTSHTFALASPLPVASRLPSGLQATVLTQSLWPARVSNS